MSYLYSLPTTGSVKFATLVTDPSGSHASDLARATSARNRVRSALKEARRAESTNKDWPGIVSAIQDYIPYLLAIIKCTEIDDLILKGVPVFSWRSTLSATSRKTGRVSIPGLYYELSFVLLTYALAYSNVATSTVHVLGQYERDLSVSEAERKSSDVHINGAAENLCRAAGILLYLSETVIPQWESQPGDLRGRPPEVTREVTSALSKICMADAEKLAIRRLLSKSIAVATATLTPGPPLPRSHPSPSLLSKLYLNVYTLYDSGRSLAKSVGNSSGITKGNLMSSLKRDKASEDSSEGISPEFRTYLSDGRAFSSSLAYKWLGVDAGENANKPGDAVAWLALAKSGLLDLQKKGRTVLPLRKGKVERAKRKDRLVEELEDIQGYYNAYKRTNDTVLFHPVPSESSLLTQVPAGRSVLALKPYALPSPAFSPRKQIESPSPEVLAAQAASMGLGDENDSDSDASEDDGPVVQSNYF